MNGLDAMRRFCRFYKQPLVGMKEGKRGLYAMRTSYRIQHDPLLRVYANIGEEDPGLVRVLRTPLLCADRDEELCR